MNRVIKKKLALALALVMIVGLVPMTALAAMPEGPTWPTLTRDQYIQAINHSVDVYNAMLAQIKTTTGTLQSELINEAEDVANEIYNEVNNDNLTASGQTWKDQLVNEAKDNTSAASVALPRITSAMVQPANAAGEMPSDIGTLNSGAVHNMLDDVTAAQAVWWEDLNGPAPDKTALTSLVAQANTMLATLTANGLREQASQLRAEINSANGELGDPAANHNDLFHAYVDLLGEINAGDLALFDGNVVSTINQLVALKADVTANPGNYTNPALLLSQINATLDMLKTLGILNDLGKAQLDMGLPITAAGVDAASITPEQLKLIQDLIDNSGFVAPPIPGEPTQIEVHRLYNAALSAHLLSSDAGEMAILAGQGWVDQGIAFDAWSTVDPPADAVPVHRFYTPDGRHMYSANAGEIAQWKAWGWQDDGVLFYQPTTAEGGQPVTRLFNAALDRHVWTMDANEIAVLTSQWGWTNEGTAFLAFPPA